MSPIYYSSGLVTNRLHIAALIEKKINEANALTSLYNEGGFAFNLNTFATPVEGVRLLPVSHDVVVSPGSIAIQQVLDLGGSERLSPDEYWDLIDRGAREIIENVTAIVDHGLPVFSDITGGRDSRLVFGALVAAGRQRDVIFNTIANPTTPGLEADLEIGTGLVKRYGGSYARPSEVVGYSNFSVEQHLARRRSQVFGTYHWIVPSDVRPLSVLTSNMSIRLLGGGGECYDDRFRDMVFTTVDIRDKYTQDRVRGMLDHHQGKGATRQFYDLYVDDLLETFNHLPGSTVTDRINAHYLNFRNRFHFGPKQSSPESMSGINPAMSINLIRAARGLPAHERSTGRVVFDTIRAMDEELAFLPFDSPSDARIIESPYFRPSRFRFGDLDLEPARDIVLGDTRPKLAQQAIKPIVEVPDFTSVLDNEISQSIDTIRSGNSPFKALMNEGMDDHIVWAKTFSPVQRAALASKVRSFADFSQTIE
ncbi:hypothetical protein [Brachybacterium sp. UNK5269]|uniref:hypothetical protein n=1 Tax=Brachybacterium sp. UNK5269 TaxID=3408576 RepID=UPI003BAF7352